jgi:hypothetical protein
MIITKEIAETLGHRTELYNVREIGSQGMPKKCRVNGKCKTLKRQPHYFSLPVKAGLYEFGAITDMNCGDWGTSPMDNPIYAERAAKKAEAI